MKQKSQSDLWAGKFPTERTTWQFRAERCTGNDLSVDLKVVGRRHGKPTTNQPHIPPVAGDRHQRISQSKGRALGWVNAELAAEQPTFLAPRAGQESGRMADLVAYRGIIEDVKSGR